MTGKNKIKAVLYAFLAAVFYALNMPLSKLLLNHVGSASMAAFLYLGAGTGMGILFLLNGRNQQEKNLDRNDLVYVIGMIILDTIAPILLMTGLKDASAQNASLLNNFEIVATSLIALFLFGEAISARLWLAIFLITCSSMLLSLTDFSGFVFSKGSLLVLAATCSWGLENNCTRQISDKNTLQIVMIKGIFSGTGSWIVSRIMHEPVPQIRYILYALLLGFVAYGLSIFFYIRAQKDIGAAKTSAYYAVSPFAGALLSYFIHHEPLSGNFPAALAMMIAGSVMAVADTLILHHSHEHSHTITHTHDGSTHTHTFTHFHEHDHYMEDGRHDHVHTQAEIRKALGH